MTAARALQGTPSREAAAKALLGALDRLTRADSDSTRDARLALLDRLAEVGNSGTSTAVLDALLRDVDPRVADRAAAVLTAWTGQPHLAAPRPRPPQSVPSPADLARLSRSIVRVTMKGGGQFDIRLLTDLAPLSCAAFARLAASGYYNHLTIHRVVPNFVVQGGSPGANEYAGASRFMLDEVGRVMQSRGTVGTSTRGRDTGDGQFYVNLVDNPRLDHEYTIFGEVTRGMEVVDAILEGDVIERAEVVGCTR
jgi:cyclophilin family peptidyl-prolyl cis-trans isomerase